MPDNEDTTGGRDYGRRPYASRQDYHATMRRQTDAFVNRYGKRAHSEDKKPYLEDLDYPEMEMFHFDWDGPHWPPWDPPTEPDVPLNPDDPGQIAPYWPPKAPRTPFLGCFFYVPLTPNELSPGDTAFAKLARREDPVVALEIHGPATIISDPAAASLCTAAGQEAIGGGPMASAHYCTVIIRVNDDASGYAPDKRTGSIQVVLVATTASGFSCSTSATIKPCEGITPLSWDWVNSAETIGNPGSASVYVLDGKPPFQWSVSGAGFTLAATRTMERVNTLIADGSSCGAATISVRDACGGNTQGGVRSTSGKWVFVGAVCLPFCNGAIPDQLSTVVRGGHKCTQVYQPASAGSCAVSQCGQNPEACGTCDNAMYTGKSCREYCVDESAEPGCVECVKWIWESGCAFPCYCGDLCPSGTAYTAISCWRNWDLDAYEWRCST